MIPFSLPNFRAKLKTMNESKFQEFFQRQKESGLSVKEFCSNEGIVPSTFYYWKKKLIKTKQLSGFIPVQVKPVPSFHPTMAKEKVHTEINSAQDDFILEVEYPNGTRIKIKKDLDFSVLRSLVQVYE